jgi:hypothetical protein
MDFNFLRKELKSISRPVATLAMNIISCYVISEFLWINMLKFYVYSILMWKALPICHSVRPFLDMHVYVELVRNDTMEHYATVFRFIFNKYRTEINIIK